MLLKFKMLSVFLGYKTEDFCSWKPSPFPSLVWDTVIESQ